MDNAKSATIAGQEMSLNTELNYYARSVELG
jgi:hypothetical protein